MEKCYYWPARVEPELHVFMSFISEMWTFCIHSQGYFTIAVVILSPNFGFLRASHLALIVNLDAVVVSRGKNVPPLDNSSCTVIRDGAPACGYLS